MAERLNPGWSPGEDGEQSLQIPTVLLIEAELIDLQHGERLLDDRQRDRSRVIAHGGEVARPAQQIVGFPRRASAADRDLLRRFGGDRRAEFVSVAADDLRKIGDFVELEVLAEGEAVA